MCADIWAGGGVHVPNITPMNEKNAKIEDKF